MIFTLIDAIRVKDTLIGSRNEFVHVADNWRDVDRAPGLRTDQHFERDQRGIACLPMKSRCSVRPCIAGSTPPTPCWPGTLWLGPLGTTPLLMANSGVICHWLPAPSATGQEMDPQRWYLPKRPPTSWQF